MEEFGYEKLEVWRLSMAFVDQVYDATIDLPKEEVFGLRSQMRSAAVSIPSNIAEGSGFGPKQFCHHLKVALGSVFELRTQVDVCLNQKFINEAVHSELRAVSVRIAKMLCGLIASLEK